MNIDDQITYLLTYLNVITDVRWRRSDCNKRWCVYFDVFDIIDHWVSRKFDLLSYLPVWSQLLCEIPSECHSASNITRLYVHATASNESRCSRCHVADTFSGSLSEIAVLHTCSFITARDTTQAVRMTRRISDVTTWKLQMAISLQRAIRSTLCLI